uniref:Uncharacterized protein n=1 Tax=Strigamia maritima TaxID=126957 RepID=T1JLX5_STRMM
MLRAHLTARNKRRAAFSYTFSATESVSWSTEGAEMDFKNDEILTNLYNYRINLAMSDNVE